MKAKSLLIILVVYSFGFLLAFALTLSFLLKLIVIRHRERLPNSGRKLILVANHPSVIDPFMMVSLFFKVFLLSPFNAPLSVPKKSLFDIWCLFWLRPFMISVERGNSASAASSFKQIKNALDDKRMVIVFPEGGRTFK